jgi:hypothetical protein
MNLPQRTKEEKRAYDHARYIKYGDYYRKANRARYLKNKKTILAKHKLYQDNARRQIVEYFGGKCIRCGYDDIRALQIDHVNGGGNQHRINRKNKTIGYYKEIMEDKTNSYQLLCANCNQIKKVENGEHKCHTKI